MQINSKESVRKLQSHVLKVDRQLKELEDVIHEKEDVVPVELQHSFLLLSTRRKELGNLIGVMKWKKPPFAVAQKRKLENAWTDFSQTYEDIRDYVSKSYVH